MEIRRKHGFRLREGASKGDEPERRPFNEAIESAAAVRIAAPTYVEASLVIEARLGAGMNA